MSPRVLRLAPELRRRLWGGDRLPAQLGLAPPPGDEPVGEAWLAYGESRVVDGPHAGRTFSQVVAERPEEVVGAASLARYGPIVPLLAKFLDAAKDLSVQVHPDDAHARTRHPGSGHLGKTESWRILRSAPGASVVWGFRRSVTRDELRAALDEGTVDELLRVLPVEAGDVVHNPAGTVHAVGAGIELYELQQASDLTYRLWDHGRVGADGRPRELHVDASLAVADLTSGGEPLAPATRGPDGWTTRVRCPYYRLDEAGAMVDHERRDEARDSGRPEDVPAASRFSLAGDTNGALQLLTQVSGYATLQPTDGPDVVLEAGTTVALPAALGRYAVEGAGLLLRAGVAGGERGSS